jgi:LPXTG-motif cell wall-anchored protein
MVATEIFTTLAPVLLVLAIVAGLYLRKRRKSASLGSQS